MEHSGYSTPWIRACSILLFALLVTACTDSQPQLKRVPTASKIVAFGDSLTFGTGAKAPESYPAQLQILISRTVIRSGVPGEVSSAGLERLLGVLEEHAPALVLLCHGGNDLLRKKGPAGADANLRAMVKLIRASGAEVVLLGVPKPGLLLSPASHYDRIAEDLHIPYLRDSLSDILGERDLKSDTVHPNAAGYRQLAVEMAELLRQVGAVP